ncbi:MAG: molybdate ABC transporter substrate-binding protein [Clostridia bacterium]|nr:molybdate ABC transporter substrate-binding protein [Clostridia bacterium]
MTQPSRSRRTRVAWFALVLASSLLTACQQGARPGEDNRSTKPVEVVVSAAASLQDALRTAASEFEQQRPGTTVHFNFGSSGALARQIEAGAPVDVFVAAGQQPMDMLVQKGLVDPGAVRILARNQVVLIAPRSGAGVIQGWQELADERVRRIAVGDPAHVPAGQYGKEVLEHLGLWEAVTAKLVLDQDVREVLHHVEIGEAGAGIVYRTDAATSDRVVVVAEAPPASHRPVVYPLATVQESRHPAEARAFADFLVSDRGQAVLQRYGFLPAK